MPLSRLENFLKNAEGNILYVNSSDFDATDGYENQGNSLTRPFRTIQRALIEAARFSYQNGRNNDKIDRTTILVYPGTHYIDNRPGYSIENISGTPTYKVRTGVSTWTETFLNEFNRNTNFDILDPNNDLYKYNSIHGGVILPRGTSIIGLDLRKTKIRPLYVPDPLDDTIEESSIFNVTGTCYFSQFTFFDGDINREVYKNHTSSRFVPNFSHHKLVAFTYGDGVNKVALANNQTDLTDLDMYYFKVSRAYGDLSGRGLVDFPTSQDFEPSVDEYRIVGTLQSNPLGISSITYGNGITAATNLITITTKDLRTGEEKPHGLFVDSPVYIDGVTKDPSAYNGSFTVKDVIGITTFTYLANSSPAQIIEYDDFNSATVITESDTVSSASPYVFNCSIRSVYGMCGMWANGAKADGFKSMVVAQFTGVSLQKDDNAFMIYQNGNYEDDTTLSVNSPERPLHSNSLAKYKPKYESYHIRVSDGGFVQCVSIFAIGFSRHFVAESGGDMSITNSNSNFGSLSLESVGFRDESFNRDDVGHITHIIPPRELDDIESEISWLSFDTEKTVSIANSSRLYLFGYDNQNIVPTHQVDGFRVGAKKNDRLYLTLSAGEFSTPILMTVPSGTGVSSKKEYKVASNGLLNSIDANGVITLNANHQLFTGESVRIFSNDGIPPDNIECDLVYYAITSSQNPSLGPNQIQIAFTQNDASSGIKINAIGNNGGSLKVVSSVSDKLPGEFGHPIQYDSINKNWYIVGAATSALNGIYKSILDVGSASIGKESPSTFISRKLDNRSIEDRIYKIRYVVPKEFEFARPPQPGFVIQESKTVETSPISFNENESITQFTPPEYLRNEKIITSAVAGTVSGGNQIITIKTEKPHNFVVGDKVKIRRITSTNNLTGLGITSTYNGSYYVKSVTTGKEFTYEISGVKLNPGTFTNKINERDTNSEREGLPLVSRDEYKNSFYIYRVNTIRTHVPGINGQDGVYHIIALASNISPSNLASFDLYQKEFSQDVRHLYPQLDKDNYNYDPSESVSSSDLKTIGKVLINDKRNSLTKEALSHFVRNTRIGFGIVNISATGIGNTTVTLYTDVEHGLNSIKDLNISIPGVGYGNTTIYSANLVGAAGTHGAVRASLTAGSVTSVSIVDAGSAYAVNDSLTVSAPTGITPSQNAVLTVTSINNNVNDGLELSGFEEEEFNGTFRILEVTGPKSVKVYIPSVNSIPTIDSESNRKPYGLLSSKSVGISSIVVSDPSSGIASVTTPIAHGLLSGNKFTIVGSGSSVFDGTFTVRSLDVNSPLTKFDFYVGVSTVSITSTTTGIILKNSFASNASSLGQGEENLGSRVSYIYAGITTTTTSNLTLSSTTITLTSPLGFTRGDYVLINNEVVRIASSPAGSTFNIIRGQFGTYKTTAVLGSQVKKIKTIPVELRRPSFMRASGHTFEYLGYGPGNYSTGMPQKQNITLTEDEVLTSQSRKQRGGVVVYSAMNDLGEFFSGNKKQSSTTGEETVVEAPILTYTGDDAKGNQSGKLSGIFDDVLIRERLTVEGGENNNQTSQFYGPVNFTQKITNTSELGINTKKIFIRGKLQQGKQITVGLGTTSSLVFDDIISPKLGDIVLTNNPIPQKHVGFTYDGTDWQRFGLISQTKDRLDMRMDRLGIGDTSVFTATGGVAGAELYVAGDSVFQNVYFTGNTIFDSQVVLNDVRFRDIDVRGTVTFDLQPNPSTGITSDYTQVHKDGASLLNDLYVAGVSTFAKEVDFSRNITGIGATFGNIRIAYTGDNEIDTKTGNLIIDSDSGTTIVDDLLRITNGDFEVITGVGAAVTTKIVSSNKLQIGIGTTTNTSSIELFDRSNVGLSISRNAGTGTTETIITHYGLSDFKIGSNSNADLKLFTNNTERLRVGLSGTITSYQTNSGTALKGAHLKINQNGPGDVALSWDITHSNSNRRWYAGIDVSDGYSWKLSNPKTTIEPGSESFATIDETKLRVTTSGNVNIFGNLSVDALDASQNASITTRKPNFDLIDTQVLSLNFARAATQINMGSNSSASVINLRSTKQSDSTSTGGVVISGGVGIDKNLYVGGIGRILSNTSSTSTSTGALVVSGGFGIGSELYVGKQVRFESTQESTSTSTGALVVSGGVGIGSTLHVGRDARVGDNLIVEKISTLKGLVSVHTGIIPYADEGAYLGTSGLPFSEAHIGEIRIANGPNNNTIDTATGNLILDSTGGTVDIQDNLDVLGRALVKSATDATSKDTGSIITEGGIGAEGNIFAGGYISAQGAILGQQATGFYVDTSNIAVRAPATSPGGGFYVQTNGGTITWALFENTEINFYRRLKVHGSTSGNTIIQSQAVANENTLTLPKASGNITAVIARTSQADGTITLGTDTNGNYLADITAGAGLTKDTSASEGQSPTLTIGAGTGIAVDADAVRLANSASLATNTVMKWSGSNLTNSSITDNGTTITCGIKVDVNGRIYTNSITNATSKDTGSIITEGGIGVEKDVYIGENLTIDGGDITLSNATTNIKLKASDSNALKFQQGTTGYLVLDTAATRVIALEKTQFKKNIEIFGSTSGFTTLIAPAVANNTITLPTGTGTLALVSSASGIPTLGTDTNGNYLADITAGAGLTKDTSASEGQSPTLTIGAGTGIAVDADAVRLANSASLATNTVMKWSGSNLTNSSITDNGTTITCGIKVDVNGRIYTNSITNATSKDTGSIITEGGIGVEKDVYIGENLTIDGGEIFLSTTATDVKLKASDSNALSFEVGTSSYFKIDTLSTKVVSSENFEAVKDVSIAGAANFGTTTRQMLNLYGTSYALGVQSSTLYYRSGDRFNWFVGGTHSNTANDPGSGGTFVMTLGSTGNLSVGGTISGTTLIGNLTKTLSTGGGLTSGGAFNNSADITFSLGTPSSITSASTNTVSGTTHTHALDDGSVTEGKIGGGAVTNSKIGEGQVTTSKIGEGQVTTSKIGEGQVSASKLSGGQSGSAPVYGVRAWGKVFGGGGFGYGGNISSVNRTGNGDYTVNLATYMVSDKYVVVVTIDTDPGDTGNNTSGRVPYVYQKSGGNFKVQIRHSEAGGSGGISAVDAPFNFMVIQ